MTCPACDQSVDNGIKCKQCKIWLHYYCTKLPDYYLVLLKTKQNLTFYCETCVVGKCPQFVTDQAKIKSAIESQRLARSGIPVDSDKQTTPPGTTNSNIKDVLDNHPPRTGTDETDGLSGKDGGDVDGQKSDKIKNDYCKFHLQGRCKFGRRGKGCHKVHPPLCRSFILKGDDGCDKGENCRYTHPKLCVKSLQDKSCPRKNCHFYHVTGSVRPNRPKTTKAVSHDSANNTVPKNSQHSPADQNLHLHKQPVQPVQTSEVNTSKHAPSDAVSDPQNSFLEKINQRMANMEQMQNFLLQFIAGHQWSDPLRQMTKPPLPMFNVPYQTR